MTHRLINVGVIPAAGQGVRAYPDTRRVPKVMLEVAGKPLLERNVSLLRDRLGIRKLVLIVGHLGEQIRRHFGAGDRFGVEISYVDCPDPGIGLARGLCLVKGLVEEPFVTLLGDELYLDSNHEALLETDLSHEVVCAVLETDDPQRIRKNYSVAIEADRIVALEEKPSAVTNPYLGCGTYVFRRSIFDAIERTPSNPRTGRVELTDAIATLVREGRSVVPFRLSGDYFNINSLEDRNYANYMLRNREFGNYRVSVVIPAWNEASSIGYVVRDFLPRVDEVLVADNRSSDGTARIAEELGARVHRRDFAGYGDALRHGLDQASGDILIPVEADHSFRSTDLGKILEYLKDADLVVGTRTTRQMIEQGTNMRGLVRWANVFFGKFVEALWWSREPRLTDVGCTYRAIWRETYLQIRDRLRGLGPEFAPEMVIEVIRQYGRVIEIPVSYYPRIAGESKHSGSYLQLARTALAMLRMILRKRLGRA